ncbi:unnamed protein product [Blepharisma stoltei]|uniref:C3H1-type domain-containing protein n=1 Tax=Blepharisma stoltei TaxID=1481888 RepID=A0AAU9K317_9CILI|nr:unnamed protein product [Blepharisma stoltei]
MYYFDARELEEEFKIEDKLYRDYLIDFHVAKCPGSVCITSPCLFYHEGEKRRRRPFRFSNGAWSYKPQLCIDDNCEYGETCVYAHNKDEINYHPMVFKTIPCSYPLQNGVCSKNGEHCFLRHAPGALREPSDYFKNNPRKMWVGSTVEEQNNDNIKSQKYHTQYKINQDNKRTKKRKTSNFEFERDTFKVFVCNDFKEHDEARCLFYHTYDDQRRDPKKYKYRAIPCRNAYNPDNKKFERDCFYGNECEFAHNKYELFYHKDFFRKYECKNHDCDLEEICPFTHNEESQEVDNTYDTEELRNLRDKNNLLKDFLSSLRERLKEKERFICHFCKTKPIVVVFVCGHAGCRDCGDSCQHCNRNDKITLKVLQI